MSRPCSLVRTRCLGVRASGSSSGRDSPRAVGGTPTQRARHTTSSTDYDFAPTRARRAHSAPPRSVGARRASQPPPPPLRHRPLGQLIHQNTGSCGGVQLILQNSGKRGGTSRVVAAEGAVDAQTIASTKVFEETPVIACLAMPLECRPKFRCSVCGCRRSMYPDFPSGVTCATQSNSIARYRAPGGCATLSAT